MDMDHPRGNLTQGLGHTTTGVILRHLLELAPAAWHTAYEGHHTTLSHSSPNSETQELSAVEQRRESIEASLGDQAAAAGKNKEREAETKGEEGDRSRSCR